MIKSLLFLTALGLVQGLKVPHPDCPAEDHFLLPHEYDCSKFYYCEGGEKFKAARPCPPGTEFSFEMQVCTHPILANCGLGGASTTEGASTEASSSQAPITQPPAIAPPSTQPSATAPPANQPPATQPPASQSPASQPPATQPPAAQPPATQPPTAQSPTTVSSQGTTDCERFENGCPVNFDIEQYFEHEISCRQFYRCVFGEKILQRCPRGTSFNVLIPGCDHPANVDRTCEDIDSSEEDQPINDDDESRETDFLENGCPVDSEISWLLPHERYCNVFYQCSFGQKLWTICPPGTQFNPTNQACDHPSNVNCQLPGGNAIPTTTESAPTTQSPTRPPIDLDANGCPVDQSISWLVPSEDCTKFYFCVHGSLLPSQCPNGLHFSPTLQRCENPATAGCANGPCSENTDCSGEDKDDGGNDIDDNVNNDDDDNVSVDDNINNDDDDNVNNDDDDNVNNDDDDNVSKDVDDNVVDDNVSDEDIINDDDAGDCDDKTQQDKKCEEECHVLPWAHDDCDKFWTCYGNKALLGICTNGLFFNPSTNTCDFACNVDCDSSKIRVTPNHDGLKMYIPWHKFDKNARQLLKLINGN